MNFTVRFMPLDVAPMYWVEASLTRDGFTWACTAGPGGELQEAPAVECLNCFGRGKVMESLEDGGQGPVQCACCEGLGTVVSWKGCEVRVRCRYKASEFPVLDKTKLLAEFAEASLLHFDPIPEKDHALRAPEVAAAKTLPDKVAAWCAIAGTVASEGVQQKLSLLELQAPEAVISAAKFGAEVVASGETDETATVAA